MCAQLNPLAHIYYKKWKEVVENRGGKVFAAVVQEGTVWTNGDKPYFAKYLAQAEIQERRDCDHLPASLFATWAIIGRGMIWIIGQP